MTTTGRRLTTISLALVTLFAVLGFFTAIVAATRPPSLHGISTKTLASSGIVLHRPAIQEKAAKVDSAKAKRAARAASRSSVREAVLADVEITGADPATTCTCWVVSLNPTGIVSNAPAGVERQPATFAIELIDAMTGELVLGVEGGPVR